jgi:hypothetical protein
LLLGVGKLGIEIQKVFNLLFDQSQVNLKRDAPLLLAFTHAKDCTSGLMPGLPPALQATVKQPDRLSHCPGDASRRIEHLDHADAGNPLDVIDHESVSAQRKMIC